MKGLRYVIDIKKSDEKIFFEEALYPMIKKGILKTKNIHMREQEIT
ncbi:MAG: hypothetical protein HWN68_02185 [Desulfobacterales bacterium]|nr:hypothetical protein [Desulfobacterales bacterium]